jgi:hypothetical protein
MMDSAEDIRNAQKENTPTRDDIIENMDDLTKEEEVKDLEDSDVDEVEDEDEDDDLIDDTGDEDTED